MQLPLGWRYLRQRVFHRDGFACVKCGSRRRLECDHIVPVSDGGTHEPENLRTLCRDCHIAVTREAFQDDPVSGQTDWNAYVTASPYQRRKIRADLP